MRPGSPIFEIFGVFCQTDRYFPYNEMQNIDFSRKIRREPLVESEGSTSGIKNRAVVTTFALCILAFTVGIAAGVQIMRVRGTDSLVRFPDKASAHSESRSSEKSADPEEPASDRSARVGTEPSEEPAKMSDSSPSRYLIKVGTFPSADADRIARRIAKVPELKSIPPAPCKGLKEQSERGLAFRIAVKGQDRENLFLGCFADPGAAHEALGQLKASGISQASSAIVFEIE